VNVTIIGGGYVGLVTGACLAHLNHTVTIIDIDKTKVDAINNAKSPIYEEGLDVLLKEHIGKNLKASLEYASIQTSDIVFITVGTPPNADGSSNLSYIISAAENIAKEYLIGHTQHPIVVIKSTVPPGTTENIVRKTIHECIPEVNVGYCMNPEFLREGRAIADFFEPDRIIIGSSDQVVIDKIKELYENLDAPILVTGSTAAEMIKYTANAFLATKISFSNEIGNLCKKLNVDVYEVMKGVGLDHRISPFFLNAGAGFGGSCFPKDVSSLASMIAQNDLDPVLLKAVLSINSNQPEKMILLLKKRLISVSGKRIAVLGLAFKDNTDDIRESRSIPVIEMLLSEGAVPVCYDPKATENMMRVFPYLMYCNSAKDALKDADGCLVMTEWSEFAELDAEFSLMKNRIIIDGRHILTIPDAEGVCW